MIFLRYLLIFSVVFGAIGCALTEPEFEPFTSPAIVHSDDKPLTTVPVIPAPEKPDGNDLLVIKWLVPEAELDGYIIRYGFSATSLDYEERLSWGSIPVIVDQEKGKIFVHNLRGLPTDKTIFVSLAGIKDDKVSKSTAIFSVNPAPAATAPVAAP